VKPRPSVIVTICSKGLVIRGSLNFGAACTGVHAGLAVPVVYHALASNSDKEARGEAGEIIGGITDEVVHELSIVDRNTNHESVWDRSRCHRVGDDQATAGGFAEKEG
jgi:hypothetical protein